MNSSKEIIVVGAGISGICVAYQLLKLGAKVTLIGNTTNHSSVVAAGMINPIVFRRMNKGWRADEFVPYLTDFYKELEQKTETSFFHPISIRRMFSSEQERDFWMTRQHTDEYSAYMETVTEEDVHYSGAINLFGSGRVKNASYVEALPFLSAMKAFLRKEATVIEENVDFDQLSDNHYRDIRFEHIVFCEGYLAKDNPWFKDLPMNPSKGELLTIESKTLPEHESVNRKCFILPLGNHTFKIGSTYDWTADNLDITEKGKGQILDHLSYLTKEKVTVIDQVAGIRPTVIDRRPLIGSHFEQENYHIFNGLGTKGYMLAPLISLEFAHYLLRNEKILPEMDVQRFYPGR